VSQPISSRVQSEWTGF